MDGSFVNLAPFLGRHDSPFYYSFFFWCCFCFCVVFVLFCFVFGFFFGCRGVFGGFLGGIGGVISYIWCHVCSLVVAFVTNTPVHQHVTVTDHLPPVQFTGLTAGRHTFSVHLVLGTHDLLLTTLLATGKRTV